MRRAKRKEQRRKRLVWQGKAGVEREIKDARAQIPIAFIAATVFDVFPRPFGRFRP